MGYTVLFLGLIVLWVLHYQLSQRVDELKRRLEQLEESAVADREPDHGQSMAAVPAAEARAPMDQAALVAPDPVTSASREDEAEEAEALPPAPAVRETLATLFERFVGGRLLIWVGGIALAVAGVFLVGYSIEIGLMTPPVRMIMAAIFGFLLLGAGEYVRSRPGSAQDPRTAQALVGAGILVLYAAPYGSLVLYSLISVWTASTLMVMVTAVALILSLRHGAPTAVMGLAGGFVTPLLVGNPNAGAVPLLAYVGLLDIALFTIAQRRGWAWLAAGAVLLSFVWTGFLLVGPEGDATAAGLFIVVLSIAASLARPGEGRQLDLLRPAAIGLVQLALLVARVDLGLIAWLLFGALAGASLLLARLRPQYRVLPPLALGLALLLLALKAATGDQPQIGWIAAAITTLFAAGALSGALRGSERLAGIATVSAAFAGPAIILRAFRPELLGTLSWGLLVAALAAGPLFLAWSRRSDAGNDAGSDRADRPLFVAAASALLLLGIAASDLVDSKLLGSVWMLLAAATALAAARLAERGLSLLALIVAAIAIVRIVSMTPGLWTTLALSIGGFPALAANLPPPADAFLLLVLPTPFLYAAWHWLPGHFARLRPALLAAAGLFLICAAYIVFKQIFGLSSWQDFEARGFGERLIVTQALFALGWLLSGGRVGLPWIDRDQLGKIGTALSALAAARLVWFDMLIHNPALADQYVGSLPFINVLLPAYLLSAFWLYAARRRARPEASSGVWLGLFLASLILGVMLIVRQLFQGPILTALHVPAVESYGYSLAGLLLSIALLLSGIRLPDKALRLAGLVLLTATIVKAFLVDAAVLDGLLRILSFLGLGIALIGIGKLYSAVLSAEAGRKTEMPGRAG